MAERAASDGLPVYMVVPGNYSLAEREFLENALRVETAIIRDINVVAQHLDILDQPATFRFLPDHPGELPQIQQIQSLSIPEQEIPAGHDEEGLRMSMSRTMIGVVDANSSDYEIWTGVSLDRPGSFSKKSHRETGPDLRLVIKDGKYAWSFPDRADHGRLLSDRKVAQRRLRVRRRLIRLTGALAASAAAAEDADAQDTDRD